jgi:beta-galactosidase
LVDPQLIGRWKAYVEQGGNLILSCRTGQKDRSGQLWQGPYVAPIRDLIGGSLDFFDQLPTNATSQISFNGKTMDWNNWGDVLTPFAKPAYGNPAEVWATHKGQFYDGKAAILHRKVGKGSVTYNGIDSDDGELEFALLQKVYASTQIKAEGLTPYFFKEWRDGFWVAVNYTSEPQNCNAAPNAKFHFGKAVVAPGEVAVWVE